MVKTFIIAEAGVNHNGDINLAKKLIDIASAAGADAIKFQTFKANKNISKNAPKADYQIKNTSAKETQYEMIKSLELSEKAHLTLFQYCRKKNIQFLSTPFDHESINFLNSLGLEIFKIPSGEIVNLPYLRHIGKLKKKVILSTGMSTIGEIEDALNILISSGTAKKDITVLHANTEYPSPFKDVNLLAMQTIANTFKVNVGYSDHTLGIEIPIAAVALGATIIEKHFTLDRNMKGPDHKASLEPHELKEMIRCIRNIEIALGDGIKVPSQSEKKNILIARKSIHYSISLRKGHLINENDIIMKRPGSGVSPKHIDIIINRKLIRDVNQDEMFSWEDIG
ncbi:MAG: N-acetylneuraminate synthase [Bacteroidales bacterium]